MNCPFCDIIDKEIRSDIVYETENVIAFLDIDPINEGHILVVPKIHKSSLHEIPLSVLTDTMDALRKISVAINDVYKNKGYSIMQNGGEFCDFGHIHFHIFPRYENDGFGWKYPEESFEASDKVAKRIAAALQTFNERGL